MPYDIQEILEFLDETSKTIQCITECIMQKITNQQISKDCEDNCNSKKFIDGGDDFEE